MNKSVSESLTISQVCEMLSISAATAKNWIRLGKLQTDESGKTFSESYIENLAAEIKNGKDSRLKSRRNKKCISGRELYSDYITNENNRTAVERILTEFENVSENQLRIILAYFATELYRQSGGKVKTDKNRFENCENLSDNNVFNSLISDLLSDVDLSETEFVSDCCAEFVPYEDTLGFVYISLRDLSLRKQTGAYFTPAGTVNILIDNLSESIEFENKTFCDPCCGTGNFLIGLLGKGVNSDNLYGQDMDKISVMITRINMFLLSNDLSLEHLYSHFTCGNTLTDTSDRKFSVVLGNPPWGYDFSKEETACLVKEYCTAKNKGMESYDLFIEKGLSLLEKDGYLAYVLPEALLSVSSHLKARELIAEKTSFRFVNYLGNVFSGVQCPSIILGIKKDGRCSTKQCRVTSDNKSFTINTDREIDASLFSFNINDDEYDCLKTIASVKNAEYLKDNAKFALGIVTGNNKKYIKDEMHDGCEVILKGSDILRYKVKDSNKYIRFTPEDFQQVAPTELYRAEEKLLYRFISDVPVFAYDNNKTLSLNSCNILIPQIKGMSIKYVLAVLNSSVSAFFIKKKFNSLKMLRSHIESLPLPVITQEKQEKIIEKVDCILKSDDDISKLYDELDIEIMELYQLNSKQQKIIREVLKGDLK